MVLQELGELGMWDVEDGINDTFSDVIELFTKCKYNNCSHSKGARMCSKSSN